MDKHHIQKPIENAFPSRQTHTNTKNWYAAYSRNHGEA